MSRSQNIMRPAVCIGCGCDDLNACMPPCSWLRVDRRKGVGVCSNCQTQVTRWDRKDRAVSPRALLLSVLPLVQEYRDQIFAAQEIKGRVECEDTRAEIAQLDRWIKDAEAVTQ